MTNDTMKENPTPQEQARKQIEKAMDACVLARAELYKVEMLLRKCGEYKANNKEAVK